MPKIAYFLSHQVFQILDVPTHHSGVHPHETTDKF